MSIGNSYEDDTISAQCDVARLLAERDELIAAVQEIATHTRRAEIGMGEPVPTAAATIARAALTKVER